MAAEPIDSRDERIGRILNEYLDRARSGEPPSEAEWLEAHPDLAEELRAHFGMVRQVHRSATQSSRSGTGISPVGATGEMPNPLPSPDALPGYEILDEIHRGGQGVVYQALQKATRRRVAIKVMREGPFAGWRDRARFEREVQILAGLNHPGIVTIHDSGTAAGCHFFVMDYVVGLPLDIWLGRRPRSLSEILKLFVRICDAVNQAHLKGIIHRDLKPGNIRIDDQGNPHILDFGLAKATAPGGEDGEAAGMTIVGQFVGSLPWTSPEQAQGLLDQVDTRTDVYALGVIFYQLLTRAFPYEVVGAMRDVLNRIVTIEPIRPRTIRREIHPDVEAIVLKCLHKEPHRRYQTAGELGRDVERYLNGEPVGALAGSGLYVLGKTLRRHRAAVGVAAAFAILIGASLLASVSLWRQAAAERDRAVAAQYEQERERRRADAQAAAAQQARELAERERARAQDQAEQLRRTTYRGQIALAHTAYEQRFLTRAQELLEAAPADLRGWEWHYLQRLAARTTMLDVPADQRTTLALSLSPEGRRVITGGSDGVIRMWDAQTGAPDGEFSGHEGAVNAVAFSPDGGSIASSGRDRTLRLWDVQTGEQRILEAGRQQVNALGFSPDGTQLVAGGQARVLTFWDVATGQVIRGSEPHEKEISCITYSPDSRYVASGELLNPPVGNGRIRIWDVSPPPLAAPGAPPPPEPGADAPSPLEAEDAKNERVEPLPLAQSIRVMEGPPGAVLSLAYSPDGRYLAVGGGISPAERNAQGTLKILNATTGEARLSLRGHDGFVDAVAFSPDGRLLASAGALRTPVFGMEADQTLKIWDASTGDELSTYSAHSGGGRAVAWGLDAERIFSVGMDGRLKAWPTTTPPEARVLQGHTGPVRRIAFSPDGTRLASGGAQGEGPATEPHLAGRARADAAALPSDNTIRVWDLETHSPLLVLSEHRNAVLGIAWSPDGRLIASGGADRTVRLWDAATGQRQLLISNPGGTVRSVAFSPDSASIAAIGDYAATVWSTADGSDQLRLPHRDTPASIAFSHDGQWIATGLPRGEIRIWDRTTGRASHAIRTPGGLNGAWFSPDTSILATAHTDGIIAIWDVHTGQQVGSMFGAQRSVEWLDFSPDGLRLASSTADMMLKIWDVPSASEVYSVRAHDAPVTCVRFSPDGRTIATCSHDGLIKLWHGGSGT